MSKSISSICDGCESEFTLSFNENLVMEHDTIVCPFCGESIESVEEDIPEDYDMFDEDSWTE